MLKLFRVKEFQTRKVRSFFGTRWWSSWILSMHWSWTFWWVLCSRKTKPLFLVRYNLQWQLVPQFCCFEKSSWSHHVSSYTQDHGIQDGRHLECHLLQIISFSQCYQSLKYEVGTKVLLRTQPLLLLPRFLIASTRPQPHCLSQSFPRSRY